MTWKFILPVWGEKEQASHFEENNFGAISDFKATWAIEQNTIIRFIAVILATDEMKVESIRSNGKSFGKE